MYVRGNVMGNPIVIPSVNSRVIPRVYYKVNSCVHHRINPVKSVALISPFCPPIYLNKTLHNYDLFEVVFMTYLQYSKYFRKDNQILKYAKVTFNPYTITTTTCTRLK